MAHEFKIETKTQMPAARWRKSRGTSRERTGLFEAVRQLGVGHCVFIPVTKDDDVTKVQVKLCAYAIRVRKEKETKSHRFATRRMDDGVRLWRTK